MAWWQNEAGEPLYSPEAIRSEEAADCDPGRYHCDDCGFSHVGPCDDGGDWN